MDPIKAGIVFEGEKDHHSVIHFIKRFLAGKGISIEIIDSIEARTAITKLVPAYTKRFFDPMSVEMAIYLTDQDNDDDDRRVVISKIIESINPTFKQLSVVAVPRPHYEHWLLVDQDSAKNMFRKGAHEPLPHEALAPKDRMRMLSSELPIPKLSDFEIYQELASNADIEYLRTNCSEFAHFTDDLLSVARHAIRLRGLNSQ